MDCAVDCNAKTAFGCLAYFAIKTKALPVGAKRGDIDSGKTSE